MSSTESYIQSLFADRLGGNQFGKDTKIYKFEKIKRAKRTALDANPGKELFDMGVGEPDEMADAGVVKALQNEAEKPENRGYTDNGIDEFKAAAIQYMEKDFWRNRPRPKEARQPHHRIQTLSRNGTFHLHQPG